MILTPIDTHDLPGVLDRMARSLEGEHPAHAVFVRIATSLPPGFDPAEGEDARRADAVALARAFDIATIDEPPQAAFSWDGEAIRTVSEPSVVIHEVAHYQLAAPDRRGLYDFGLGAGPESGRIDEANAVQRLDGVKRDVEEGLTSLLGIIWEAELGHPALLAFLEQNWCEGVDRRENREHFLKMVGLLIANGLLDDDGRPLYALRTSDDETFFRGLCP